MNTKQKTAKLIRFLSFLLVLAMLVGSVPDIAFASNEASEAEGVMTKELNESDAGQADQQGYLETLGDSEAWDGTTKNEPSADADGVYQIGTAEELAWFAEQVNITTQGAISFNAVLTGDIDLNNKEWTPIGSDQGNKYKGSFDGRGYSITGLSITSSPVAKFSCGLFGSVDGVEIKNLSVSGRIDINSSPSNVDAAGGLVGKAYGSSIVLNCFNSVGISVTNSTATVALGGIVGNMQFSDCKILCCGNFADISSIGGGVDNNKTFSAGGICGFMRSGCHIDSCWNRGNIKSTLNSFGKANAGGILGTCNAKSGNAKTINNCFSIGSVSTESTGNFYGSELNAGGIQGRQRALPMPALNCYYLQSSCGAGANLESNPGPGSTPNNDGISAKSESELKSEDFIAQLNGNVPLTEYSAVWVSGADSYPEISEVKKHKGIKSFIIDGVSGVIDGENMTITLTMPAGTDVSQLTPVITCFGNVESVPASGQVQDFTNPVIYRVGDLTYTVTVYVEYAITGEGTEESPYLIDCPKALVKMSELFNSEPANYSGKYWKQTCDIDMSGQNFSSIGTSRNPFSGQYDGGEHRIIGLVINGGGLFAAAGKGVIIRNVILDATCSVKGNTDKVGGIVGSLDARNGENAVLNCTNRAEVVSTKKPGWSSPNAYVGGIVGYVQGQNCDIIDCRNYGNVRTQEASTFEAAGIVAKTEGKVINCHNYGNITAPSVQSGPGAGNGSMAGGIVANGSGLIAACSNCGKISAGLKIGGIAARFGSGILENCFNTGEVEAIATDVSKETFAIGGIAGEFGGYYLVNCYSTGEVSTPSELSEYYIGSVAGRATSKQTKDMSNNYFIGSAPGEGIGYGPATVDINEAVTATTAEYLKSEAFLAKLNEHQRPLSLYKVVWAVDSGNENGGYPLISDVSKIQSYYAELIKLEVDKKLAPNRMLEGVIEGNDIAINLPYGTVTIVPTAYISEGASISPESGTEVNVSSGHATFTVTAEDGTTEQYRLNATIPTSPDGFMALRLYSYNTHSLGSEIFSNENFIYNKTEYTVDVIDRSLLGNLTGGAGTVFISAVPAESGADIKECSLNGVPGTNLRTVNNLSQPSGSIRSWYIDNQRPENTVKNVKIGENVFKITSAPPSGGLGQEVTYTIKINVTPTLSSLSFSSEGVNIPLDCEFDSGKTAYQLNVPAGTKVLNIAAQASMEGIADIKLPDGVNGNELNIEEIDSFVVRVGTDDFHSDYTITLNKAEGYTVRFNLTPAETQISLRNSNGNIIARQNDGSYVLSVGEDYAYTAACYGYVTKIGHIRRDAEENYFETIVLERSDAEVPADIGSQWPNFRGAANNMAIVDIKTARDSNENYEKWKTKFGSGGFANAPSIQIIVDDKLIVMEGILIYQLDMETGDIIKQAEMVKSINWGYTPPTYADGMIFAPLNDGTVQAFDASTLESLWVYTDELGGQSLSPISYSEGYVFTGFWNGETENAAFVCIPVTDEDENNKTEAKIPLWRDVVQGGFYWAGSALVGEYIVYGTDDGQRGYTGSSSLICRNKNTGALVDRIALTGDQRSSIANENGTLYLTTKAGYLYAVPMGPEGKFGAVKSGIYREYGEQSTSTPVVYNGHVYFGIGNGVGTAGHILMVNADTFECESNAPLSGYPQCSVLLTKAYEQKDGSIYLYSTYNMKPGGVSVIKVDQNNKTMTGSDLFIPDSGQEQYCIASVICDNEGTIYYKNDSGYIFALAKRTDLESIFVDTSNVRLSYALGESFDCTGLVVTAVYTGNEQSVVDSYVLSEEPFTQTGVQTITVSYTSGDITKTAEIEITVSDKVLVGISVKKAPSKVSYAHGELFDASGMIVVASYSDGSEAEINKYTLAPTGALSNAVKAVTISYTVGDVTRSVKLPISVSAYVPPGDITVTFRLIGAELAEKDVDLSASDYLPNYVTWIPTERYTLSEGSKVYDLFMEAMTLADLKQKGADTNYVSAIYAPDVYGGYELAEFTNGRYSGWMYTVNGDHPNVGLKDWVLHDGDVVVWHYVNDYRHEVHDWFNDPDYPALGDGTYFNGWLKAADTISKGKKEDKADGSVIEQKTKVGAGGAEAVVDSKAVDAAVDAAKKSAANAVTVIPTETGDAENVTATLPTESVEKIADAGLALNVETPGGSVEIPSEALAEIAKSAEGDSISVNVAKQDKSKAEEYDLDEEVALIAEVTVTSAGREITSFGGHTISVYLPVEESDFTEGESYEVLVISKGGSSQLLEGVCVKMGGKLFVKVEIDHLSTFIVTRNKPLPFKDVKGHWAIKGVRFAYNRGFMAGVSPAKFNPDGKLTRGMLVTMLHSLEGKPGVSGGVFSDVELGKWYTQGVAWAKEKGIVAGFADGTFRPEELITREQFATIMMSYARFKNQDVSKRADLSAYSDAGETSAWALDALKWAKATGLMNGRSNTLMAPKGTATRAEAATILMNYLKNLSE